MIPRLRLIAVRIHSDFDIRDAQHASETASSSVRGIRRVIASVFVVCRGIVVCPVSI